MTAMEWDTATDWSNLPDVYVTKAECAHGMFWRIEACSVPMAIGPEVRLVRADLVDVLIAEAVAKERAVFTRAIETYFDATAVEDVEEHAAAIRAGKE